MDKTERYIKRRDSCLNFIMSCHMFHINVLTICFGFVLSSQADVCNDKTTCKMWSFLLMTDYRSYYNYFHVYLFLLNFYPCTSSHPLLPTHETEIWLSFCIWTNLVQMWIFKLLYVHIIAIFKYSMVKFLHLYNFHIAANFYWYLVVNFRSGKPKHYVWYEWWKNIGKKTC